MFESCCGAFSRTGCLNHNGTSIFYYCQAEFIYFISGKCLSSVKHNKGLVFWLCGFFFFLQCIWDCLWTGDYNSSLKTDQEQDHDVRGVSAALGLCANCHLPSCLLRLCKHSLLRTTTQMHKRFRNWQKEQA